MEAKNLDENTLQDMQSWLSDEVCSDQFDPHGASDQQLVDATDEFYPGGARGFIRDN